MKKLTNIEMSNHLMALKNISGKVSGKLAYAVSRNMRKLANEVFEFDEIRNKLINKYGEKNDDGIFAIKIGSDSYNKFIKEISEFTDIEHEVDIYSVKSEILYNSDLNADEMLQLDFMIEEE